MAKKKIEIDVEVDDKGTTKKVGLEAKKTAKGLNDVATNSRTADRNIKGVAQASANGTKNFSKMAQGMGGLVGAYATFAASVFALSAAFEFLKNASDIAVLEQSQVQFAQNSGVAMQSLTTKLRTASKGMLDFQSAAAASAMGLAKGFSSDQMAAITEGAVKVSNVLGRDFKDSFDRLTRGVSKAEPELLDELAITLRLEVAKKKYAQSLGISADALTAADQSQAVYLETMRQLAEVVGEQEGQPNPFVQLGVTFSDLAKTLSKFILPPLEALASFLNKNAAVAALFFGAIGLSIIKNMPFVDDASKGIKEFFDSQIAKADSAKKALAIYSDEIEKTKQKASDLRAEGIAQVKSGATKALEKGATSAVLTRAAAGEMKGPDKTNLKKALASAEAQYKNHGKITRGIFKEVGIDIAREIGNGLVKVDTKVQGTNSKIMSFFKRLELRAKVVGTTIKKSLAGAFTMVGKAAAGAGKAMNAAMKATVILGTIQVIFDMIMAVVNAPKDMLDGIIKAIQFAMKSIQFMANMALGVVNYLREQINKIPGIDLKMSEKFTFGDDLSKEVEGMIQGLEIYKIAEEIQTGRQEALLFQETLNNVRSTAESLGKELNTINAGRVFDTTSTKFDPLRADRARANTLQSLPVLDLLRELDTLKPNTELYTRGLQKIQREMKGLEKISPAFQKAVTEGNTEAVERMTMQATRFTANIDSAKDQLDNMSIALKGASSEAILSYTNNIAKMGNTAKELGDELGFTTDILDKLNERFKTAGGIDAFVNNLRKIEERNKVLADLKNKNEIANLQASANLTNVFAQRANTVLAVEAAEIALLQKRNELEQLYSDKILLERDGVSTAKHQKLIEQAEREIALSEQKLIVAEKASDQIAQMGLKIGDSLQSNMQTAFNGLIEGTMTVKQAFASMAKSILVDISRMITKMLVMRLLQSAIGGTSFGNFLGVPSPSVNTAISSPFPEAGTLAVARNGGIMKGYSEGGIARGRNAGYPAILHGTEAVVPLPNGNSIPVEMRAGATSNNTIGININIDNQGNASTSQDQASQQNQAAALGKVVASVVQEELHKQKRPGGILSRYGAA